MPEGRWKGRKEASRPDWKRSFREGAEDVLRGPFGEPVYWFCPERFQLPLWPEFLLRIRWSRAESVTHYSSYVYALEFPLYGDLTLVSRDREVVVTPGSAGIVHRGEYSMLKAGPSGFCSKLLLLLCAHAFSSVIPVSFPCLCCVCADVQAAVPRVHSVSATRWAQSLR